MNKSKILNALFSHKNMNSFFYSENLKTIYVTSDKENLENKQIYIDGMTNSFESQFKAINKDEVLSILKDEAKSNYIGNKIMLSNQLYILENNKLNAVLNPKYIEFYNDKDIVIEMIKNLSYDELRNELKLMKINGLSHRSSNDVLSVGIINDYIESFGLDKAILLIKNGVLRGKHNQVRFYDVMNITEVFDEIEALIHRKNYLDIMPLLIKDLSINKNQKEIIMMELEKDVELKDLVIKAYPDLNNYKLDNESLLSESIKLKTVYFKISKDMLKRKLKSEDLIEDALVILRKSLYPIYVKENDINVKINLEKNNGCYLSFNDNESDEKISEVVNKIKRLTEYFINYNKDAIKEMRLKEDVDVFLKEFEVKELSIKISSNISEKDKSKRRKL